MQKHKSIRIKKIRDSARGQDCTVNTQFCSHNNETTVLAHYGEPGEKGVGIKADDTSGFYSCYDCHIAIDQHKLSSADEIWYCFRACRRTWKLLLEKGVLE